LRRLRLPADIVLWLAFTLTVGYGLLDELHQSFVPGRLAWARPWRCGCSGAGQGGCCGEGGVIGVIDRETVGS